MSHPRSYHDVSCPAGCDALITLELTRTDSRTHALAGCCMPQPFPGATEALNALKELSAAAHRLGNSDDDEQNWGIPPRLDSQPHSRSFGLTTPPVGEPKPGAADRARRPRCKKAVDA